MIDVRCHQCGTQLRLPADWSGKKGRCPSCGQLLVIPATPSPAATPIAAPAPVMAMPPEGTPSRGEPLAEAPRSALRPMASFPVAPPGRLPPRVPASFLRRCKTSLSHVPPPIMLAGGVVCMVLLLSLLWLATRSKPATEATSPHRSPSAPVEAPTSYRPDETAPARTAGKTAADPVDPPRPSPVLASGDSARAATSKPMPVHGSASASLPPPAVSPPNEAAPSLPRAAIPAESGDNRLTGMSRRYDNLDCQQIQARHGIRIPAAATILDVDGQRLPVSHAGSLATSPAPVLFLPRGSHAVCFRSNELPLAVTIRGDLLEEYEAMRKYFDVGGQVKTADLMSRAAKTMDVHGAPFLLDFFGAQYAAAGKWDVAERKFRRALCVNPAFSPAHLNLAECLLRRNQLAEAAREVALADAFNVGNVFGLADAIHQYRKRLKLPAEEESPLDLAGLSYLTAETQTEEDRRLTAILEGISKYALRDEERAKILNNLAVHFADTGRPELALYHFHRALEVVLYAGEGRYELARQVFANMKGACRKSGFAEAAEYEQMEAMVLR